MHKILVGACALAVRGLAAPASAETIAITNARILTAGPAGEIAQGTVVIRDGKIASVGAATAVPAGARVIDAAGATVAPGFFATSSLLGAVEVGSLGNDLSVNNPDLGAAFDVQYSLNPESILLPVARLGGLTSAVVMPIPASGRGGDEDEGEELTAGGGGGGSRSHALFAGQAAVIHLA
jgi:imidazolonepropionase-like amidohydrolase